jgi:hypothetical protein
LEKLDNIQYFSRVVITKFNGSVEELLNKQFLTFFKMKGVHVVAAAGCFDSGHQASSIKRSESYT